MFHLFHNLHVSLVSFVSLKCLSFSYHSQTMFTPLQVRQRTFQELKDIENKVLKEEERKQGGSHLDCVCA